MYVTEREGDGWEGEDEGMCITCREFVQIREVILVGLDSDGRT